MRPDEIKVGSSYRTARNEVRHVIDITAEKRVIFKARNSAYKGETGWYQNPNPSTIPLLHTFAYGVIGEVPYDWDSATTPPPLPKVAGIKHNDGSAPPPAADAPKKSMPDLGPP